MPNKILFQPKEGTSGFFRVTHCQCNCHKSGMMHIRPCCECGLIKTEIVNPEVFYWEKLGTSKPDFSILNSGDLFDLPEGYEFKDGCTNFVCEAEGKCECSGKRVLRLVKTETKEADHNASETARLESCPFCGGKPGQDVFFSGYEKPGHFLVKCGKCQTQMRDDRPDKVVSNWNQRAKPEPEESHIETEIECLSRRLRNNAELLINPHMYERVRMNLIEIAEQLVTIQRKKL